MHNIVYLSSDWSQIVCSIWVVIIVRWDLQRSSARNHQHIVYEYIRKIRIGSTHGSVNRDKRSFSHSIRKYRIVPLFIIWYDNITYQSYLNIIWSIFQSLSDWILTKSRCCVIRINKSAFIYCIFSYQNISSRFSSNSEACASELQIKCSHAQWCLSRFKFKSLTIYCCYPMQKG